MQQSRRELIDQFLETVGDRNDVDARNRAERLLSTAVQEIWLAHPWRDHILPTPVQVTTVAGQSTYALPQYFGRLPPRVECIKNLTTGREIAIVDADDLRRWHPTFGTALAATGTPQHGAIGGVVGVRVQPSTSGQALEVLSDHAGDTDVRVLVEGVTSDDEWDEQQVTLAGTTPVAIGTWKAPLITFSKAYPSGVTPATEFTSSRGTVTLRVVGGGVLQTLRSEESAREFPSLTLAPAPSTTGEVYAIPCLRAPKRLLYDADECPRNWGPAILEEMLRWWKVQDGETPSKAMLPTRSLSTLIGHDNTVGPRLRTRPFTGI